MARGGSSLTRVWSALTFSCLCLTAPCPGAASFWFGGSYSWVCQPVDYSTQPEAQRALALAWWFYLSKFIDFFDSIFFILRCKWSHLSTLHVVHHATLPFFSWFGPKFAGGGNTTFGGMWNSLVHVAMYSYYFLSACGPG